MSLFYCASRVVCGAKYVATQAEPRKVARPRVAYHVTVQPHWTKPPASLCPFPWPPRFGSSKALQAVRCHDGAPQHSKSKGCSTSTSLSLSDVWHLYISNPDLKWFGENIGQEKQWKHMKTHMSKCIQMCPRKLWQKAPLWGSLPPTMSPRETKLFAAQPLACREEKSSMSTVQFDRIDVSKCSNSHIHPHTVSYRTHCLPDISRQGRSIIGLSCCILDLTWPNLYNSWKPLQLFQVYNWAIDCRKGVLFVKKSVSCRLLPPLNQRRRRIKWLGSSLVVLHREHTKHCKARSGTCSTYVHCIRSAQIHSHVFPWSLPSL